MSDLYPITTTSPSDKSKLRKPEAMLLQRTHSFNKLISTYNICAQNIYFLPNLLIWLKTTILQNYIEKLIINLKSIALQCTIYLSLIVTDNKYFFAHFEQFFTKDVPQLRETPTLQQPIPLDDKIRLRNKFVSKLNNQKVQISKFQGIILRCLIYFSVAFSYAQMAVLMYILCLCEIPLGMAFLLITGLSIVLLSYALVSKSSEQKKQAKWHQQAQKVSKNATKNSIPIKSSLLFGEKTISKVKLF